MKHLRIFSCLCVGLLVSCNVPISSPHAAKSRVTKMFPRVKQGMTADEVLQILGQPSEIRTYGPLGVPGWPPTCVFAYGSHTAGGFAKSGIVRFDPNNRVVEVVSPIRGCGVRPNVEMLSKCLDLAHPVSNILCVIKGVTYDSSTPEPLYRQQLRFSLINQSHHAVSVPTPTHSVARCIAVEVYDAHKRLFFRKDEGTRGTVGLGSSGFPSVCINAGGSVDDTVNLWLSQLDFGEPPPGQVLCAGRVPFSSYG